MFISNQPSVNFSDGAIRSSFLKLLPLLAMFCLSGCGDFFAEKPTELESKNVLRELGQITPPDDSIYDIPAVYTEPPRIVEGKVGDMQDAKLFYFSKHHAVSQLVTLVNEQFRKTFADAKGKPYPVVDYTVSQNSATNQIIVRCPTVADAEQVLEFLDSVDVPPIQVKIDCLISEVYADHTMDWETTIAIDNLLGGGISLGGKENSAGTLLPAFPGAALRDAARSAFGLKTGYVYQEGVTGHEFKALVDLLVSRGYLKILMNPQLEVVNGRRATIETSEHVPLDLVQTVTTDGVVRLSTQYQDVKDSLEVTPTVFAGGYIGLKTRALIGSRSTPDGVKQIPIVTKREINVEENRVREGESLVIGGIRKTEKRSVVRGVPFLKDIPLIGILFSSKDFEERGKEVLFILTPTISSGGLPSEDVYGHLKSKHDMVKTDSSLTEMITDPFGTGSYTELIEEEATTAEVGRVKAEIEKGHAERRSEWLTDELRRAKEQAESEREQAESAKGELDKVKVDLTAETEVEKQKTAQALAELEKLKVDSAALTEAEKQKVAQALAELEKLKVDSAALTEAEKQKAAQALAELEKVKAESAALAEAEKQKAAQAQAEAAKAKAEAEAAKAEAARIKAEAEKAKEEQDAAPPEKVDDQGDAEKVEAPLIGPEKAEPPKEATPPPAK